MRNSYIYADFPASLIAERVATALSTLPARKILELVDSKKIVITNSDIEMPQTLTYRNLRCDYLDDYLSACGMPMKMVLFGNEIHQETHFSYFDKIAIELINALPEGKLPDATHSVLSWAYHNPAFDIPDTTPSGKLVSIFLMSDRLPKDVPAEDLSKYRTDINAELSRFRKARRKERHIFHIDSVVDLCSYCHVSPHWAFSSTLPCFCNTSQGDEFFDAFCLLSRREQVSALAMLMCLCEANHIALDPERVREIWCIISEEGRTI